MVTCVLDREDLLTKEAPMPERTGVTVPDGLDVSPHKLKVYVQLARLIAASGTDDAAINITDLGDWCDMSPSTVNTAVKALADDGWIEREATRNPNGSVGPTLYRLKDTPNERELAA